MVRVGKVLITIVGYISDILVGYISSAIVLARGIVGIPELSLLFGNTAFS